MSEAFRIDCSGRVARIVLTRAERHNAFDEFLIADLTVALKRLGSNSDVDTVVLAAEGKSFSAGADLGWMKRAAERDFEANVADAERLAGLMRILFELPQTTIAEIQGAAFGGGVGLIACCDIAIAVSTARFALNEVKLGLIPAAISPYVIAAIGARQARRYFQSAEVIDAAKAMHMGLVHEVVEEDELRSRIDEITTALSRGAPGARRAAKQLVVDVSGRPIDDETTSMTAHGIAERRATLEAREGLDAFFDRRDPAWITAAGADR